MTSFQGFCRVGRMAFPGRCALAVGRESAAREAEGESSRRGNLAFKGRLG